MTSNEDSVDEPALLSKSRVDDIFGEDKEELEAIGDWLEGG